MERWLTNLPSVTQMEIVAVAAAALFLCLTPLLFSFGSARRRRATAVVPAAGETLQPLGVPMPDETPEPSAALPSAVNDASDAGAESVWPPLAPAVDAADTPAAQFPDFGMPPPAQFAPTPAPSIPTPVEKPSDTGLSDAMPVARLAAFTDSPEEASGEEICQLIELRQARLPDWPPPMVRENSELEKLWEAGERLAARYDRAISTTVLRVQASMQASALGGVVTDGRAFRLHFLLFDELWPTDPSQAQAVAIFEVDPESGPQRSWVRQRSR